ncbi:hypothetical protein BDFB_015017, partial [Asbolus verrucosus]
MEGHTELESLRGARMMATINGTPFKSVYQSAEWFLEFSNSWKQFLWKNSIIYHKNTLQTFTKASSTEWKLSFKPGVESP